jgi:peroxiredoxin
MPVIQTGEKAPDFTLKDHTGESVVLSNMKGSKVLLSFHPLAWTTICAKQMKSLEASVPVLDAVNTVPFGISVDSVPCKKAWANHLNIKKTRLLSDFWPHGKVAGLYGIFRNENGFSERANIIVDEAQTVVFTKVYPMSELPDIDEVIHILEEL